LNIRTLASLGFAGVNVFLLLSGLGLTISISKIYLQSETTWRKLPWKSFFWRRILRIYPLYIFAHILFFITGILIGRYADMPLNIGFLLSITGLRVFFPDYFWYGPHPFWFVGLILQFYLLFPLLFWLILKTGTRNFLLITFIVCGISRLITTSSVEDDYTLMLGLFPNRLAEFSLGMAIGYNFSLKPGLKISDLKLNNKFIWIAFLLTTVIGLFIYWQPIILIKTIFFDLFLAIICFSGLTIIALTASYISPIYNVLIFIGGISYCFYLLHSPPIRPAFTAFNFLGIHNFWLITLIYLSIIILVSYALTYLESLILPMKRKS
jgi:peptidoglycan/LPS O-acetylase OafA/YrhL